MNILYNIYVIHKRINDEIVVLSNEKRIERRSSLPPSFIDKQNPSKLVAGFFLLLRFEIANNYRIWRLIYNPPASRQIQPTSQRSTAAARGNGLCAAAAAAPGRVAAATVKGQLLDKCKHYRVRGSLWHCFGLGIAAADLNRDSDSATYWVHGLGAERWRAARGRVA